MDALMFNLRQEHVVICDFKSTFHQVTPGRLPEHPLAFLSPFQGHGLLTDKYSTSTLSHCILAYIPKALGCHIAKISSYNLPAQKMICPCQCSVLGNLVHGPDALPWISSV